MIGLPSPLSRSSSRFFLSVRTHARLSYTLHHNPMLYHLLIHLLKLLQLWTLGLETEDLPCLTLHVPVLRIHGPLKHRKENVSCHCSIVSDSL